MVPLYQKKTPGKPTRKVSAGRVIGIFGYVSYAVFFGALLLSLGMFGLSYFVQANLIEKQERLVSIQEAIDDQDIAELTEFDGYLRTTEDLFAESFSIFPILDAFSEVIADPVVFEGVSLNRDGSQLELQVSAVADSFDATMFQRDTLTELPVLAQARVEDVNLVQGGESPLAQQGGDDEEGQTLTQAELEALLDSMESDEVVTFALVFDVSTDELPFALDAYEIDHPNVDDIDNDSTPDIFDDEADSVDFDIDEDEGGSESDDTEFFEELTP